MKIKPLHDFVLIRLLENKTEKKTRIILPDSVNTENYKRGEIVAIGDKVLEDIKVGNKILFSLRETKIHVEEDSFFIIKESDIIATID